MQCTTLSRAIRHSGRLWFFAVALAIGFVSPIGNSVAVAQNNERVVLEEITVTARRREEALRDLATSISVIDADELVRSNLNDIGQYFLKTPNVSITELQNRDSNQIAMRGITNSGDGVPGTSFAFYVDEFNMAPFSNNPQLNDVAQIEILRGPQGTYFGRNAAGGAINVTTNKPSPDFDAAFGVGASRFNTWNVEGMVNAPISEKAFVRATVTQHESDGYLINTNPNGGDAGESYFNGRVALRLVPSDNWTFDLTAIYANNELDSRFIVPTHQIPPSEAFIADLSGNAVTDGLDPYPINTRYFNEDTPSRSDRDYTVIFGRIEYVGENFSFTNVTGWGESETHRGGDVVNGVIVNGGADQSGLDAIRTAANNELDEWSTEFRLASVGDGNVHWTIGAIYSEGDSNFHISTGTGNDIGQLILPIPPNVIFINDRNNLSDNSTWAVFGEVDWDVNDQLTLTYGGRYNEDKSSFEQFLAGNPNIPFSEGKFDKYVSRFAATYDISDQLSIYGVASQGFKAGAAATTQADTNLDPVKPETLWNYEAGIRGNLMNGRGRYSLSAFFIDWEDLQVSTRVVSVDPVTMTSIVTVGIQNAAKASSAGLEFEFAAVPTDSIELNLSLGWLDTEYDQFPDAALSGLPNSVDLSGKKALQAPELTVSAGGQYNFNIGDADAYLRLEYSYVDDKLEDLLFYAPPADLPPLPAVGIDFYHVPSYDVWNFRAGYEKGNWTVDAFLENIADDNFYNGTYSGIFASGIGVRVHQQNYGIRFRWDYE